MSTGRTAHTITSTTTKRRRNRNAMIGRVLLNRYRVLRVLGSGGMATVYEAEHQVMKTRHAIKVLNNIAHLSDENRQRQEQRFLDEARTCVEIRHPNLVVATEFAFTAQGAVLVMDYLEGKDYWQIIQELGRVGEREVLRVGYQTALALQVLHNRRIIHRDLKPANIMLEAHTGRVVLMDLGIAKSVESDAELTTATLGTPAYMAPEQARDSKSVTEAADIYGLAASMVTMLVGEPPVKTATAMEMLREMLEKVKAKGSILGLVPQVEDMVASDTLELIRDMTRYDPTQRIQNIPQLIERMAPILERHGIAAQGDGSAAYAQIAADTSSAQDHDSDGGSSLFGDEPESGATAQTWSVGRILLTISLITACVLIIGVLGVMWNGGSTAAENSNASQAGSAVTALHYADIGAYPASVAVPIGVDATREFALVSPGSFVIGSQTDGRPMEAPRKTIAFTQPYYLAVHEVDRGWYARFLNSADGGMQFHPDRNRRNDEIPRQFTQDADGAFQPVGQSEDMPVSGVSQLDARAFAAWVAAESGLRVRLPGEAEWEYAARGPESRIWPWGDRWFPYAQADNKSGPAAVGSYPQGVSWCGIHDMAGNLFEWTADWYDEERYQHIAVTDPRPESIDDPDVLAVVRGGGYVQPREYCRSAFRIGVRAGRHEELTGIRLLIEVDDHFDRRWLAQSSEQSQEATSSGSNPPESVETQP